MKTSEKSEATTFAPAFAIRRAKLPFPHPTSRTDSPRLNASSRSCAGQTSSFECQLSSRMWSSQNAAFRSHMSLASAFEASASLVTSTPPWTMSVTLCSRLGSDVAELRETERRGVSRHGEAFRDAPHERGVIGISSAPPA